MVTGSVLYKYCAGEERMKNVYSSEASSSQIVSNVDAGGKAYRVTYVTPSLSTRVLSAMQYELCCREVEGGSSLVNQA